MASVPNVFATLPATPNPSAALIDQNFAALVAAINAIVLVTGQTVNPQTGAAYTVQASDLGKLVTLTNGSAIAVTLPQATGLFTTPFFVDIACLSGSTGSVTITPVTSTINGVSALVVPPGKTVRVVSDGTNFQLGLNSVNGTLTLGAENAMNPLVLSSVSTVAHGLPRKPDITFAWFQCLTIDQGFAVGDRIMLGTAGTTAGIAQVAIESDATNTNVILAGSAPSTVTKAGGAGGNMTLANWKLVAQPAIVNGGAFV